MQCPNCAHENTPDARFCENCGQPLERTCPNCGKAVSPTARFCSNCGYNLAQATARPARATRSASLDMLRRNVPQALTQRILAERDNVAGERKLVTTLFADIVGSTALAEQMDPEEWHEIVSGAHQRVSEAIYRYEGIIAQLLGDGVLAFFGAPLTHEDDAERAIRAALDILASIQTYTDELRRSGWVENFQMRIGLNTGIVVVGLIGSDLHMEYLAVGDTVNLAARLQSAAEPNTILISESTRRLTHSLFNLQDRGQLLVRGKAEPIQVYQVLGERKGAVRARGIAGLASPMIGRARELATLMQMVADVRAGRGAAVAIIGEAGLGKSRLVAEWRKAIRAQTDQTPVRLVEGRCISYGQTMPYHLSRDILRNLFGITPEASEHEAMETLWQGLVAVLGEKRARDEAYPFLGYLLGLPLPDDVAAKVRYMDGAMLQTHYCEAFRIVLLALAQQTPTIVICEDIHWADPSSVELGRRVMPVAAEAPLLLVFVTRPDRDSIGWRLVMQSQDLPGVASIQLHLTPLSEADSRQLVSNLLEVDALPETLRQRVLAKAEGNPFYVEEVLRMLIDNNVVTLDGDRWVVRNEVADIEIPDTLQGVLMARLDRLPEDAKRLLQVASVIGRKFPVQILASVMAQEETE